MSATAKNLKEVCGRNLVAGYIDGELDEDITILFEEHLESCAPCRSDLRAHRLFICELDAVLTENASVSMPADFSRIVAVRAASDMSGVRSASEHKKALSICVMLALAGFTLLGATARDSVFVVGRRLTAGFFGLVDLLWNAMYDTGVSIAVILRVLSRKLIVESGSLGLLLVLLVLAVVLLSRLISNYHRTGATG
jgi:predicted anti-sigma-YlaC factor YlaD